MLDVQCPIRSLAGGRRLAKMLGACAGAAGTAMAA